MTLIQIRTEPRQYNMKFIFKVLKRCFSKINCFVLYVLHRSKKNETESFLANGLVETEQFKCYSALSIFCLVTFHRDKFQSKGKRLQIGCTGELRRRITAKSNTICQEILEKVWKNGISVNLHDIAKQSPRLRLLRLVKFPRFSYSWLEKVSNKYMLIVFNWHSLYVDMRFTLSSPFLISMFLLDGSIAV